MPFCGSTWLSWLSESFSTVFVEIAAGLEVSKGPTGSEKNIGSFTHTSGTSAGVAGTAGALTNLSLLPSMSFSNWLVWGFHIARKSRSDQVCQRVPASHKENTQRIPGGVCETFTTLSGKSLLLDFIAQNVSLRASTGSGEVTDESLHSGKYGSLRICGVQGWGENADNCNWIKIN